MTNFVIIIGCDRPGTSLHRYSVSLYLSSILLTKYNLQANNILRRKRQVKNFKHVRRTSMKTEEIGAYSRTSILER
jgi:hypothetical protein